MTALFFDFLIIKNNNFVGLLDGTKPVGDDDGGPPLNQFPERILNEHFGMRVEGAGSLVEDEDTGILEESSGDRKTLSLAARKTDTALTDDSVDALGKLLDEFVGVGDFAGDGHFFFGGSRFAIAEVFGDGLIEKVALLHD